MDIHQSIRKYALQNAVKFNGRANPGALVGKLIAEDPSVKDRMKEIMPVIQQIVKEVNDMPVDQQLAELEATAPELLEKKERKRDIFAFLGFKETDRVNTAFPPGPEKYPHMGHAKACLLNYMLAKRYNSKFVLRFEDTNPKTAKAKYYDIMLKDFAWLGISWDELVYASDHMDMFYERGLYLIQKGLAYIDTASAEEIKLSRETGRATASRNNSVEENLTLWHSMATMPAGSAIVRLKIDLKHKNSTMRDPTIFRIIDEPHPRTGTKYRVWPNYDFQNAIMDAYSDIDMRLRSKEFEMRNELQRWIQEKLDMKITATYEFARFNMTGVLSSGRVIREKIENGELIGWDDPSLTTIATLRRRGFLPEAIKNFVISTGISKSESTLTWDDLIMHNRRLLDGSAKRFSAIFDPVEVTIEGTPSMDVELNLNPNNKTGGRPMHINEHFILSRADVDSFVENEFIRIMDCINVRKDGVLKYESSKFEEFKGKGKKIINWLPGKDNITIEVLMPDKTIMRGLAEKNIASLKLGEVIQFERFAFCRLDAKEDGIYRFWFSHV